MSPKRVEFIIPTACVAKARPRTKTLIRQNPFGQITEQKTWGYTARRSSEFAKKARLVAQSACQQAGFTPIPFPNPVRMKIEFLLNRRASSRPDILNLAMQIADVLQGVTYDDDSQVVEMLLIKKKAKLPMTYMVVEEI